MERGAAGRGRGSKKDSAAQPEEKDATALPVAAAPATKRRGGRQCNGEPTALPAATAPCPTKNKASPLQEGKEPGCALKENGSSQGRAEVAVRKKTAPQKTNHLLPREEQSHLPEKGMGCRGKIASQKKQEGAPRGEGAQQVKVKVASKDKPVVPQREPGCTLKENGSGQGRAEVAIGKKNAPQKVNHPLPREEQSHLPEKGMGCRGRKASQKNKEGAPKGEECDQAGKGSDPNEKKRASQVKQECALSAPQRRADDAAAAAVAQPVPQEFNQILKRVLKRIKLKKAELVAASQRVNKVRDILVMAIRREPCFRSVEVKGTGSYYEHVKVCTPNEFDIMLKVPDLRLQLESCDAGAASGAFYYVKLKRNPKSPGLDKFLDEEQLSSFKMLLELRRIIVQEVEKIQDVAVERKKPGSPAVTLIIGNPPSVISVDITLALEFRQRNWSETGGLDIQKWLGTKVKQAFLSEPLYLVPKHVKDGKCYKENTWRLSFSNVEKSMITNHGNSKTCCEAKGLRCCRKDCLKLLKYLLEQLKTRHQNKNQFDKFNSYHAKTAYLHACVKWPKDDEWLTANLAECFLRFLDYFLDCLRKAELQHFFIPKFNFFCEEIIEKTKCNALAKVIESEKQNRFPIF